MKTRDIITERLNLETAEAETAERMVSLLAEREGKPLTKRDRDRIAAEIGDPRLHLRRQHGMCRLETGAYWGKGSSVDLGGSTVPGVSLIIAHHETSVDIPSAVKLREMNTAYFNGIPIRNAGRAAFLETDKPEAVDALAADWRAVTDKLGGFLGLSGTVQDSSAVEDALGLPHIYKLTR